MRAPRPAGALLLLAAALLLGIAPPDAGPDAPPKAPAYVQKQARKLVARGDRGAALKLIEEAREGYPRDPHVHWMLGRLYAETGRRSQAESSFRKAVELNDKHALAWSDLAALLERRGAHDEALEAADRAVTLSPDSAGMRADRAIIRYRLGLLDAAISDMEQANRKIRRDPDLLLDHALLRLSRGQRHDTDKAVALLTVATRLAPRDPIFDLAWAQALLADGETKQAADAYDALLEDHPRLAWAAYGRGLAAWRQGDHARSKRLGALARSVLPRTFTASAWSRRRFHARDARAYLRWLDARLEEGAAARGDDGPAEGEDREGEDREGEDREEERSSRSASARPAGAPRIERLEVTGACEREEAARALRSVREEVTTCYGDHTGRAGFRLEARDAEVRVVARLGTVLDESSDRCLWRVVEGLSLSTDGRCVVEVTWNRRVRRLPTVAPLEVPDPRPPALRPAGP
ncbi:MAG: tetratricopeptide repeat protein [Myxococcota bacterium]